MHRLAILPLLITILSVQLAMAQKQVYEDIEKQLQTELILAEAGDTVKIPAGYFKSAGTLSLDGKENIVITGEGMDRSFLSFAEQRDGAEGLRISDCKNIVVRDLTLQDASGDLLKAMNTQGLSLLNVRVEWTGKPKKTNGAYGLYPVSCSDVLIDGCEAKGASDAGIYVGQSHNIIVRNCSASYNVAGIEIENSTLADVHDCHAYMNTGGILIFDLPDLPKKKGGNVRVYNNEVRENNYKNFAPKGNIVASVPSGTGIMILATNEVDIYGNKLIDNKTASLAIVSYELVSALMKKPLQDKDYYPYPTGIYVHENEFQRPKKRPTWKNKMGFLLWMKFKRKVPHIIYDGITDPALDDSATQGKRDIRICIRDNVNGSFANLDAANDFKEISTDLQPYDCERRALPAPDLSTAD